MTAPVPLRAFSAKRGLRWQERAGVAYPLIILLALGLVVGVNLLTPLLHENLAIYWVWADQFNALVASGNPYPRWLPLSYGGLGAPVFYFYPPLAFHLTAAFALAGLSTYAALMATFTTAFALSGAACWHWLRGEARHPLLGAMLFMAAPYHLFDFAVRGGVAECLAIGFLPILATGLRRIGSGQGWRLAAVAYAAMICTHLPLALLASLFLVAPYALLHRASLARFALATGAGIGLSAIYLLPALMLQRFHDVGMLYRAANLRTDYWSLYAGHWADGTFVAMFAMTGALAAVAATVAWRNRSGWALYALVCAVIVAGIVPLLWSLPLLRDVQYPYRALPLVEFGLATAIAQMPFRAAVQATILPLLVSVMLLSGFHPRQENIAEMKARHPDVFEYLPPGVLQPGQTGARLDDVLAARIPPPRVPGMIVEPTFTFPAWSCALPEPRTQLVMHRPDCTPRLVWTRPEKLGAAASLIAALLLVLAGVSSPARAAGGTAAARRRATPS